jgi:hypothetical protein
MGNGFCLSKLQNTGRSAIVLGRPIAVARLALAVAEKVRIQLAVGSSAD